MPHAPKKHDFAKATIRKVQTMRHNRKLTGFNMIEVIIALAILGVLAILIVNNLQIVQAKARDETRRSDIDSIATQLEGCYNNKDTCNHTYPSLSQLTDTLPGGFLDTNLKGLTSDWLYDSSAGIIQSGSASAATQYQYTTSPDGCTGTNGDAACKGFTLRAYQETNPDHPYVKDSLNK